MSGWWLLIAGLVAVGVVAVVIEERRTKHWAEAMRQQAARSAELGAIRERWLSTEQKDHPPTPGGPQGYCSTCGFDPLDPCHWPPINKPAPNGGTAP